VESLTPYSAPLEGRRGLLRLDFNENTVGPSPAVVRAIRAIPAEHYAIYPEYDGLREAVARSLGPPPQAGAAALAASHVGLFNGVDAALHALFHAYGSPGQRLLTTSPSFGYYTPCARMQGMTIEAVPYCPPRFTFPLDEIHAALGSPAADPPRLLLICNPNNPTGTCLAAEEILSLAAAAPRTLVVVDELYEAFGGDSVLPLLLRRGRDGADPFAAHPNVVLLRSLSKTSGLAGLRIGFALAAPAVVDRLARVGGPYDVNSFAVTAAFAALDDPAYVADYVAEVLRAREWLLDRLRSSGVRHHAEGGNYLLLWPRREAAEVDRELRREGILVRSMAGKPLIDGSLRVSIGTLPQMERFWQAYRTIDP
jgi:histidinol-phosphate aminotransferase